MGSPIFTDALAQKPPGALCRQEAGHASQQKAGPHAGEAPSNGQDDRQNSCQERLNEQGSTEPRPQKKGIDEG